MRFALTDSGFPRVATRAKHGAQEGTRTLTPYGTRPSNVCVYQFHHLSIFAGEGGLRAIARAL